MPIPPHRIATFTCTSLGASRLRYADLDGANADRWTIPAGRCSATVRILTSEGARAAPSTTPIRTRGSLFREDLEHIIAATGGLWSSFDGARIFVTGGTGFFGKWLLGSLMYAADHHHISVEAVVLTRDAQRFRRQAPYLADDARLRLVHGDVRSFRFPEGSFTHVVHAATEAGTDLNVRDPLLMLTTIVDGTRRVLEFARLRQVAGFLLTSSGAVYGRQPADRDRLSEDHLGGPDPTDPRSAYAEGKRVAELLCVSYLRAWGVPAKIARCFAFVGPHAPLDAHYAIGNFIRDALRGGPITVTGDGTAHRSYLYAADLAVWLWTILARGQPARPYNVGSEASLTIAQLAARIAALSGTTVRIAAEPRLGAEADRYVPSTRRARDELGLVPLVELDDAIERTLRWYRQATD